MTPPMAYIKLPPVQPHRRTQRGVVLIIALIMLVVISFMATLGMRNAASSEAVSGNVRTTVLATQAAEIALRHCEETTVQVVRAGAAAPTGFSILAASSTPRWREVTTTWDSSSTDVFQVPLTLVNQAGTAATFQRPPECMVENLRVITSAGVPSITSSYVVTARGFGPEVPADPTSTRTRPVGSEVWLQSTIELE
jgi:type IV pilus assembly protein PilX